MVRRTLLKGIALNRRRPLIVILLTALLLPGLLIAQQPETPVDEPAAPHAAVQLRRAVEQLEAGEPDAAMTTLGPLAANDNAPPPIRYAANLLLHQLNGSFVNRQSVWLTRSHVDVLVAAEGEAAFVEAVQAWSDERAFPVMLDEAAWQMHLFARAYEPKTIHHLPAADEAEPLTAERFKQIADQHNRQLAAIERDVPMPGLVVIDPTHEHRLGGLALAVGRGQPILLIELSDPIKRNPSIDALGQLNQAIMSAAARVGLITAEHWTAITLAGDFPLTYRDPDKKRNMAVDDLLGRNTQGLRLAVVGRFWGSRDAAIYQAMGSLFLQPDRALLFDDYANRGGEVFQSYRMEQAAEMLAEHMRVAHVTGNDVRPIALRRLLAAEPAFDLVMRNTSGSAWHFDAGGRGAADDLAMGRPRIYHVIHSFSAQRPDKLGSIAGRAMVGGGYWYFGSVDEPYLHAFVQPTGMVAKYLAGTPLAFATRHHPGHPLHRPWKLTLFGDPLLAYREQPAERVDDGLPDRAVLVHPTPLAEAAPPWPIGHALIGQPPGTRADSLDDLTSSQLAVAALLLFERDEHRRLLEADPDVIARSEIATILVRQVIEGELSRLLAAGDLDAATPLLERYLHVETGRRSVTQTLNRWLAEMAKAGRSGDATRWMRQIDQQPLTDAARNVIRQKLAPPADDPDG